MAVAVDVREPLLPLNPHNSNISNNSQDLTRLFPDVGTLSRRPKIVRKSASIGATKAHVAARADPMNPVSLVENFVTRGPSEFMLSPESIVEVPEPAVKMSQRRIRTLERHGEEDIPSKLEGNERDGDMIQHDDRDEDGAAAGEVQESTSILQLKMEAMTWAALAKDDAISSLERRLRQALEIAKAEQERNNELGRLLRESHDREVAAALKLQDATEEIGQLIEAEERLCVQLGDLEAEAVGEDRRYRSQIMTLTARVEAQDQFISEALKSIQAGQESAMQQSGSLANAVTGQCHGLAEKLEKAETEVAALRANLSDANTELRVSEVVRKRQARKLKVLEKDRRYLTRKGPSRSVRVAPRARKESEREAPGGEGWKVFSILDFQD